MFSLLLFTLLADSSHIVKADAHLHLVDFLQNGEYWSQKEQQFILPSPKITLTAGERGARIVGLLKRMQEANVDRAMITGMPYVKRWEQTDSVRSKYYLDSSSRAIQARDTDYTLALAFSDFLAKGGKKALEERKKLYPFISGFDATDMGAVDMIVKRIKEFPGFWEGIGEIMSHHDDLTNLSSIERPRGDHPALHRISDFAGEVFLPVSIHHNMAPVSSNNKPREALYLTEITQLFAAHPNTSFIWCHAGISRRVVVDDLVGKIRKILTAHQEHVYIDLSWVVFENYIFNNACVENPVDVDNLKDWAKLIAEFKNNFMIGSDMVGQFANYKKEMNKYEPLFQALMQLPEGEKLVQHLAHDNFVNLMEKLRKKRGGLGVTLPVDYLYPEENYSVANTTYIVKEAKP